MPNNPKKEARVAKREARQDEKRTVNQKKKYDSFVKQGDKEKMKLEKKYSPTQIRQIIDETPAGMRTPWMNSYKAPATMKKGGVAKYQTGGTAKAGLGSPKAKIAAASKAMKGMKPAASKVGKTGAGAAKYKMGGAKKYQTGGGTDPYAYKKKMTDTAKYWGSQPNGEFDDLAYTRDNLSDMENTNAMDRSFYDSLGPVAPGRARAEYAPSFSPSRIAYTKSKLADLETPKQKRGGAAKATYKTGGMVNPNAKVSALKKAGSKGVKSGVNPKATAAKRATGRVGGTSTAPKKAMPKAQMGGSKTPYMKPTPIDSTLTKKDVKKVFKTIKKRKN